MACLHVKMAYNWFVSETHITYWETTLIGLVKINIDVADDGDFMRFKHTHKSTTLSVADFNTLHTFDITYASTRCAHCSNHLTPTFPYVTVTQSHLQIWPVRAMQSEFHENEFKLDPIRHNCHGIATSYSVWQNLSHVAVTGWAFTWRCNRSISNGSHSFAEQCNLCLLQLWRQHCYAKAHEPLRSKFTSMSLRGSYSVRSPKHINEN